jgi:general secretion pathway protein I
VKSNRLHRERGFTLVEVMVAVLIAGLALPPLLTAFARQSDGIEYLRRKSIAHWVAGNKLEETRLVLTRTQRLFRGRRSGSTEMAGQEWYWWMTSQETSVEDFYRVEVSIGESENAEEAPLVTLVGFMAAAGVDEN